MAIISILGKSLFRQRRVRCTETNESGNSSKHLAIAVKITSVGLGFAAIIDCKKAWTRARRSIVPLSPTEHMTTSDWVGLYSGQSRTAERGEK